MNDFLRRVRRLQKQLSVKESLITLIYDDGTERRVCCMDAVSEILKDHSIVDIKCDDVTAQYFFSALLESEQGCGGSFDDLIELQ